MSNPLNILFIGDIVGRLGRKGVKEIVPRLRKEHKPDLVIANIENIAHGKGITQETYKEVKAAGIDVFTSGNHVWAQDQGIELLKDKKEPIIRPANYPEGVPGRGIVTVTAGKRKVSIINLQGRVFMKSDLEDPFRVFDKLVKDIPQSHEIIVDLHAEATSEKLAFAWYSAERASLLVGTHTHVPTADARILSPHALGYVTDVGMVGPRDGILGVGRDEIIRQFLTQMPVRHKMITSGKIVFNSILAHINNRQTTHIQRVDMVV